MTNISHILQFLPCQTPDSWVETALQNLDILLIDHAHCEKKAASTALSMMYRYPECDDIQYKLSRLAREELRHFEKVLSILQARGIQFRHLQPSRYATSLQKHARAHEPAKMIDYLIMGAFIEARSCERFAKIAPFLDDELQRFYKSLLKAEARHYQDYLKMAEHYAQKDIGDRVEMFAKVERDLILSPDTEIRFHSGVL